MKIIIQKIKNWYAERKHKAQQQRKERISNEVNEDYNCTERDGNLYLIVCGRAVIKFEEAATVSEVITMIDKARNNQINFKRNEI